MTQITRLFQWLPISFAAFSFAGASAYANSLPDISPDQIAADVERNYIAATGQTEFAARDFDPFEDTEAVAGSARLRTAFTGTAIDGYPVSGGAYLDLTTLYSAKSPDEWDVRGFERGVFLSGEPVSFMRYDTETLNCDRDTHRVTYEKDYYAGASYGFIGGIYRLYPHYRGHSRYHWRPRYYDWRRGRGHWDRRGWRRGHGGHGDGDGWRRRRDGDGDGWRRRRDRDGDDRPDRRRRDRDPDRLDVKRGDAPIIYRRTTPNMDEAIGTSRPDGRKPKRRKKKDAVTVSRPPVSRHRPEFARPGRRDRDVDRPRRRAGSNSVSTPPVSRPRPEPRAPKPVVSKPSVSKPPVSKPRPAPVSKPRPSKPPRSSVNRAVDKSFSKPPPRGKGAQHRRFYPMVGGYSRTDVYVDYNCVKEERMTIHIPQERLDAARFDGFVVILLDNQGEELPVYIPPNYVEGFRRASGQAPARSYAPPSQSPPIYNPSSREPITYGDPGPPTRSVPGTYPQGN